MHPRGSLFLPLLYVVLGFLAVVTTIVITTVERGPLPARLFPNANTVVCTNEAKICPEGSAVGRTGPNCEFTPCVATDASATNTNAASDSGGRSTLQNPFGFNNAKAGDKVGSMTIEAIGQYSPNTTNVAPNYRIEFSGQEIVSGRVRSQVGEFSGSAAVCMSDFDPNSLERIPRLVDDTRIAVICFMNVAEALALFPEGTEQAATVIMDNYIINSYPSEVLNTASVIRKYSPPTYGEDYRTLSLLIDEKVYNIVHTSVHTLSTTSSVPAALLSYEVNSANAATFIRIIQFFSRSSSEQSRDCGRDNFCFNDLSPALFDELRSAFVRKSAVDGYIPVGFKDAGFQSFRHYQIRTFPCTDRTCFIREYLSFLGSKAEILVRLLEVTSSEPLIHYSGWPIEHFGFSEE